METPFVSAGARALWLAAACLVASCSASRHHVDVAVRADPILVDPQGKRLGPRAREAVGRTLDRRLTAAFPCADDAGACSRQVRITPIAAQLGEPPDPAEVALRIAPSGPTDERVRDRVRHAYGEVIRSRYRIYADYLADQLRDADWIEIAPASGDGPTRRYGGTRIAEGLEEALTDMADGYTALEWARFEREWRRGPVAVRARPPRAARASRPPSPATPAPAGEAAAGGAEPAPADAEAPATAPPSTPQAEKPAAAPAAASAVVADDLPCRRSCSLRYRACLARCRNQPISGGGYDACTYECSGSALACRGACGGSAAR